MALVLTIGGVTKQFKEGSLQISNTANGRSTANFKVISADGTYRPAMDTEVVLTLNGNIIFAGLTQRPEESGITQNGHHAGIITTLNAVDYNAYAERRLVNGTMPAAALIVALQTIVNYLAGFGVTLDPAQVVGPGLVELRHEYVKATEVLNELATLASGTGVPYAWNIDENKVLSMQPAGGTPFAGNDERFLINQMEFYRWVPEGDSRLLTFFYAASIAAYDAALATLDATLDGIIAGLDDLGIFNDAYVFATADGFVGTERQFFIQQAEYYNYLPEGDRRIMIALTGAELTSYNSAISGITASLNAVISGMAVDEAAAFSDGYATALTGSTSAPFDIIGDTPSQVVGDITVVSDRSHYANVVIVLVPSISETNRTETFTGDGATTAFPLNYALERSYGYVTSDGNFETLGLAGEGATWTYDPGTNTITRTSAPANAAPISIAFDGTLNTFGLASDSGEIATVGYFEKLIRVESVPSAEAAQAIAEAELARALAVYQTVSYRTRVAGLKPGQVQTITVPRRNVDAVGVISDVNTRDFAGQYLMYEVTVTIDGSQTNLRKNWRDVYKQWSGDTSGRGTQSRAATSNPTPPQQTAGTAGPPFTSVQFNRNGSLGGDASFTFQETGNNVVMGTDSTITATGADSCFVFGNNCHVTDP